MDKDFLIIAVGRLLQIVITLVSVRVFTTVLSTAEVGNLYLISSLAAFFGLALINPVGMYVNRRLHQWHEEKSLLNHFFILNIYLIALSLLSVVLVYALNKAGGVAGSIDLKLLILFMALNIFFTSWNQTIIPSLNMLEHRMSFIVFTLLTLSLGLTISIGLVKAVAPTAVVWLSGTVVAQIFTTVFAILYFARVTGSRLDIRAARSIMTREKFSYILAFSLPLALTTFFMWLQNHSYRIVIEHTIGLEYLGFIGLGMAIASNIAAAAESVLQQLYYPAFYREINTYDETRRSVAWHAMAVRIFPVYISLTVMVSCLSPFLVSILAKDTFRDAWIYVVFGSWVELFRMSTGILSAVAHSEMQTRYLVKSYLAGGLLAVFGVLAASQLSHYGSMIPAVLVVSGFVTMVIMYSDMKKLMRISIDFKAMRKALLLSLPFPIALFLNRGSVQIWFSVSIVLLFGFYFVITQFIPSKNVLEGKRP